MERPLPTPPLVPEPLLLQASVTDPTDSSDSDSSASDNSLPMELTADHLRQPTPALQHLGFVCGRFYFIILSQIMSLALFHRFSLSDVLPFNLYGDTVYGFSPAMAHTIYSGATILARFYHCAAYGLELVGNLAHAVIPIHLPIDALLEVRLPMPNLSLVLSYPDNPFLRRYFRTPSAAIRAAGLFCKWVDYHVLWLAECILRSSAKGATTRWNFGKVLGIPKMEFISGISPVAEEPRDYLATLGGRLFNYLRLDLEAIQLIRPWFTQAGVLQGPTQIGAALYPIEHDLASPMDVVMSTGFERMEEDSKAVYQGQLGRHF
ncbi:hypothetical protein B0H13DRAFT_2339349 [Mycena leptocephala]|nr:hypothetical protein B0H13DRAFT_2375688 [Mycena leptocephala]KAJ7894140.1 hypothetical protein B0H13DRAFT_2339349 [Mycena leptocephala]